MDEVNKLMNSLTGQVETIVSDEKTIPMTLGALLGYVLTARSDIKLRNAVIGGAAGYLYSNYKNRENQKKYSQKDRISNDEED